MTESNRNPFSSLFSYTPLAGAVGFGGWKVYQDIKANRAAGGGAPTQETMKAASTQIRQAHLARAAAEALVQSKRTPGERLGNALGGGNLGGDTAEKLRFAYASMVADPAASLTKIQMHESLFMVHETMNKSKDNLSKTTGWTSILGRLSSKQQDLFWRKWQLLGDESFNKDASFPHPQTSMLGTKAGWRDSGHVMDLEAHIKVGPREARNLGVFAEGSEVRLPTGLSRSKWGSSSQAGIRKALFGGEGKLPAGIRSLKMSRLTDSFSSGPDSRPHGYVEIDIGFKGNKKPFKFILPASTQGKHMLSPGGLSPFILGTVVGGEDKPEMRSVHEWMGSQISKMAQTSNPRDRRRQYRELHEQLYKTGQFSAPWELLPPGQRLKQAIAANTLWDETALGADAEHYTMDQMEAFYKKMGGRVEAISPGPLTKGAFMDMTNFTMPDSGTKIDLRNLYKGQEKFDRSRRLFQFVRDLSWTPSEAEKERWNWKSKGSPTLKEVKSVKMGPAGSLERFRPVNAGRAFDQLIQETGYLTPHKVALQVLGDVNDQLLGKWGVRDGEGMVKEVRGKMRDHSYSGMARDQRVIAYDIAATDFQVTGLQLPGTAGERLKAGEMTASEFVENINKGGARGLGKDFKLGVGVGAEAGKVMTTENLDHVTEQLLKAELSHEGYIRLYVKQMMDGSDRAKGFGSAKVVEINHPAASFNSAVKEVFTHHGVWDKSMAKDLDFVEYLSATSTLKKDMFAVEEQMVSGLRYVAGTELKKLREKESFGENLFETKMKAWRKKGRSYSGAESRLNRSLNARRANLTKQQHNAVAAAQEFYGNGAKFGMSQPQLQDFNTRVNELRSQGYKGKKLEKELVNRHVQAMKRIKNMIPGTQPNIEATSSVAKYRKLAPAQREELLRNSQDLYNTGTKALRMGRAFPEAQKVTQAKLDQLATEKIAHQAAKPTLTTAAAKQSAQRLESFLATSTGALYDVAAKSGQSVPQVVGDTLQGLGLRESPLAGAVFGGLHHYAVEGKNLAEAGFASEQELERLIKRSSGAQGLKMAQAGIAIGSIGSFVGDHPHMGQGKTGSVEMRSLDMLLTKNIMLGGQNITPDIIADVYAGTTSPRAISDYEAVGKFFLSARGQTVAGMGNVPTVDLEAQGLANITDSPWFQKEGANVRFPDVKEKYGAMAGRTVHVPGASMVGPMTIDPGEEGMAGFARSASGDLQPKQYREYVQSFFQRFSSGADPLEATTVDEEIGNLEELFTKVRGKMVRGKMGPGSSYAQAGGLGSLGTMHDAALVTEGMMNGSERIGTATASEAGHTAWMSKKLAKRLLSETKAAGIAMGEGFDEKAFLSGEQAWYGLLGRAPAAYQTSLQPVKLGVYQGHKSTQQELIKIADNMIDMMVDGKEWQKGGTNLGIAQGMGADFDKDMLYVKMAQDKGLVAKMSAATPAEWAASRKEYQFTQGYQTVLNKRLKDRMVEAYNLPSNAHAPDAGDRILTGMKRLFIGKDVGRISKSLEEVKFALLSQDMPSDQRSRLFSIFSAVEETATLKVRHLSAAINVGEELYASIYHEGKTSNSMTPTNFIGKLEQILIPESVQEGVKIEIGGEARVFDQWKQDKQALIEAVNRYDQSPQRKVFTATRTGRKGITQAERLMVADQAISKGLSSADEIINLVSELLPPREGARAHAEYAITQINERVKEVWKHAKPHSKTLGAAALIGLAGTALLQSATHDPGYAAEPMEGRGREAANPEVMERINQGSLFQMSASAHNKVTPESVGPQGGGPQVTGQNHAPTARIASTGSSVRLNARGDMFGSDLDGAVAQYRTRFPGAQVRTQIRDGRRPLTMVDSERH